MLKKLRIRLICFMMALIFVLLCVIFGMIYGSTANQMKEDSLNHMHALAGRPELPGQKQPKVREDYLILRQSLQGEWSAYGSEAFDLTNQDFLAALVQAADAQMYPDGELEAYGLRYLRMVKPIRQYVFMDISAEQTALGHLVRNLVIFGVLSLLLFFGISLLITNLALKPVEKAWQEQKQFVADASHELKTPLAVILTNAELLANHGCSQEDAGKFRDNILIKSRQMQRLVEGLLELTRLDTISPQQRPLDLSALTENALLPFEPLFYESGFLLQSDLAPDLWVGGSAAHLQQVVEIFLDNALKYADPGTVTVTLRATGSSALLQVDSPGTPLCPEELEKIFLRFYRADAARSQNGSYGLGLSIAKKIVEAHNGKIWAEGIKQGNRFSVLLPLSQPDSK